jgi:hypothetical protein
MIEFISLLCSANLEVVYYCIQPFYITFDIVTHC